MQYKNHLQSKKVYSVYVEGCKYRQETVPFFFHVMLYFFPVIFFSVICDAFAQSELMPLSPGKCNKCLIFNRTTECTFFGEGGPTAH